jgi:choline-sulfatase
MPVYLQDVMPTSIELAGGAVPPQVEFHSLMPLLEDTDASSYDRVYGAYMDRQRMIREEGYKLIAYPEAGVVRLYDLTEDSLEMHDLAGDPREGERIRRMYADLSDLMTVMGDTLSLPPFH